MIHLTNKVSERENYLNALETIYTRPIDDKNTDDIIVKAIRVNSKDGTQAIRLHVEVNGKLNAPIEFQMDQLRRNTFKLNNYGVTFDGIELIQILDKIQALKGNVIDGHGKIGWQINDAGMVSGWTCATAFNMSGERVVKDIYSNNSITCIGNLDDNLQWIKDYLSRHGPVCHATFLYGIAGILAGYMNKTLLLSLAGDSSRGKTTMAKFVLSLFGGTNDSKISTTFNVTLNKMSERLDGIRGVAVLIDDLSNAPDSVMRSIDTMIYVLEGGREKERIKTRNFDRDPATWATTIIFSAEKSILSLCNPNQEGTVGRLMELNVSPQDYFVDAKESNQIMELCQKYHGLIADEFVRRFISSGLIDSLSIRYAEEKGLVRETHSGPLARMAENIAYVTLAGKLFNELFDFDLDISEIKTLLIKTAEDNLENFRILQDKTVIVQKIYPILIEYAKVACIQVNPNPTDHVIIPSKAMKLMYTRFQQDFRLKPSEIKRALKDAGLLLANDGPYSYISTVNGKTIRSLCLSIKETTEDGVLNNE